MQLEPIALASPIPQELLEAVQVVSVCLKRCIGLENRLERVLTPNILVFNNISQEESLRFHNKNARAHNKHPLVNSSFPIHDSRNIPFTGFPTAFNELICPDHRLSQQPFL